MNKQIEEMAIKELADGLDITMCGAEEILTYLMKQGYQKVDKDSVVISKEEYYELKQAKTLLEISKEEINNLADANIKYSIALENKGKETVEKIIKLVYSTLTDEEVWSEWRKWWLYCGECKELKKLLYEIATREGVEIKE